MRTASFKRKTNETDISIALNVDGTGKNRINTGVGFLDHMLTLFAKHSGCDIVIECAGDTYVDYHHTTEDIGIALGTAFAEALGDKKGINRYGNFLLPMDEALVMSAVDFSGRAYLGYKLEVPTEKVGNFDTELVEEFFNGFVRNAGCTLHIVNMSGTNSHHIIEACFKSCARSIKQAVSVDANNPNEIPSTKGVL